MGNKWEEPEVIAQQENWWDDSHNCSAALESYRHCRIDRPERRGRGVVLCIRKCFDSLDLDNGDGRVECL